MRRRTKSAPAPQSLTRGDHTRKRNARMQNQITGIVLAGGQARRMGGVDKGLIPLCGRPMVEWTIRALRPQVETIAINANRNSDLYAGFGYAVVADSDSGFLGPLAGMASGMRAARTTHILTVPCDSPLIVPDLAERLWQCHLSNGAEVCVAHDGERLQPVFSLLKTTLLDSLETYLGGGGRKIDRWYASHSMELADFSDCRDNFLNVNEPADVAALEEKLSQTDPAPQQTAETGK